MASPDGVQNDTVVNSQADDECKRFSLVPGGIALGVIMLLTYCTAGRGFGTGVVRREAGGRTDFAARSPALILCVLRALCG